MKKLILRALLLFSTFFYFGCSKDDEKYCPSVIGYETKEIGGVVTNYYLKLFDGTKAEVTRDDYYTYGLGEAYCR